MLRPVRTSPWLAILVLFGLLGCTNSGGPTWEIVAENRSAEPCDVSVELAGGFFRDARVDALASGKRSVLLSNASTVIIRSAKVVRNGQAQEVKRNLEIPVGKRYVILVTAEGMLSTVMEDK